MTRPEGWLITSPANLPTASTLSFARRTGKAPSDFAPEPGDEPEPEREGEANPEGEHPNSWLVA